MRGAPEMVRMPCSSADAAADEVPAVICLVVQAAQRRDSAELAEASLLGAPDVAHRKRQKQDNVP